MKSDSDKTLKFGVGTFFVPKLYSNHAESEA